ncbi:MAG: His-Xaa-Ser system radical SAM maturase HxsB [Candidatus Woesearchaeota archaeon]
MVYARGKDYQKMKVRKRKYDDGVLLTNDYGDWLFLSNEQHEKFVFGVLEEELYELLEKNNMILTDNNLKTINETITRYGWYLNNGPSLHIVVPTKRCNLTCEYCHALRAPESRQDVDMDDTLMDGTIDFIFRSPAKEIVVEFTGGEPLLRFDLVKRGIERAERLAEENGKKVLFTVVTNGTLLTGDMVDYLKLHAVDICLSLDGPKELHDSNRRFTSGNTPTYDSVISAIRLLKEKGHTSANALPVIVKDSLPRWKEIVDTFLSQGFKQVRFKYISNFGLATANWEKLSYTAEEFLEAWRNVMDYLIDLNKQGTEVTESLASIALTKIVHGVNAGYSEMAVPCGAVNTQLLYDYDGAIYSCDEARTSPEFKLGHVTTSTYGDLLSHPVTKSLHLVSALSTEDDNNGWWAFSGVCPLEIYKKEGSFIKNFCSDYRLKIHDGIFEYLFDKILHDEEAKRVLWRWPDLPAGIDFSQQG